MDALVGRLGVSALFIGLILGVVGSKIGGTHRMLFVAPMLGVAAGLGAFTAYDWWWAALLASVGVIAGAGIGFGWFLPLLMVPFAATFVTPVSSGTDAVIYGAIVAIATLYGIVIARRFGAPAVVEGYRLSPPEVASVAIVFGAGLGGAAAIGVALGWTEPYWVPEPILVLVLYVLIGKRTGSGEKPSVRRSALPPRYLWRSSIRQQEFSPLSPSSRSCSRSRRPRSTGSCTACTRSRSYSFSPPPAKLASRQRNGAFRSSWASASSSSVWASFTLSARGYRSVTHSPNSRRQPDSYG